MDFEVMVYDETTSGNRVPSLSIRLDPLTATLTLRELIRRRVYEEVQEYQASKPERFRGLVQPTGKKPVDWEEQFRLAVSAFEHNGFFVLVNVTQIEDLDAELVLRVDTQVTFVKLVALVGG